MHMRKRLAVLLTAGLLAVAGTLSAAALPFDVQSVLIVKMLMYQTGGGVSAAGDGEVVIGVAYDDGAESRAAMKAVCRELQKLSGEGMTINGRSFSVCPVRASDPSVLKTDMRNGRVGVLYVAVDDGTDVTAVTDVTREAKVLSVSGIDAEERVRQGVSVGLAVENGRPSILVNIESAMKEGASFSPQFLSLVKLIK